MYAFVRLDGRGDDQRSVGLGRILSWSGEAGGCAALCELELSNQEQAENSQKIWQKLFGAVFEGKTQVTQYSLTGGI